jgi:hypothetical protein
MLAVLFISFIIKLHNIYYLLVFILTYGTYARTQIILPENVFNDLTSFISHNYPPNLPNSLLIAQAFILKYPKYGREFGLTAINYAIEDGIKRGLI